MRTRGGVAGLVALSVIVVFGIASPAWAEKGDMQVRFGVFYTVPTDDLRQVNSTLELDDALGFQASFEYRVTSTIGVEPAIGFTTQDVRVTDTPPTVPEFDLGEIDFIPLTFNLNFHVLGESSVDLFLGPTIGYVFWGDFQDKVNQTKFPAEDEFTYGFNIGLDVPSKGHWAFTGALNYLVLDASLKGSAQFKDLGVDPFLVKVGASYKF